MGDLARRKKPDDGDVAQCVLDDFHLCIGSTEMRAATAQAGYIHRATNHGTGAISASLRFRQAL